jgi:alpha/beta superfamily hydrolase
MVQKGEYLERPALIEVDGLWLEGLWHRGEGRPGVLLCPPRAGEHGMDAPPIAELAFQAARRGRASLRFQHRGFGASQGRPDETTALADALGAHGHLTECVDGLPVDVVGYRSGAETALLVALERPSVAHLVLVSPPRVYDLNGLAERNLLVVLGTLEPPEQRMAWRKVLEGHVGGEARLAFVDGADARYVRGLPHLGEQVLAFFERGSGGGTASGDAGADAEEFVIER